MRRLTRSRFVRQVATVAGGTAIAQVVAIAAAPVITRIYPPEAFGALGVFTSMVAVFTAVSGFGYYAAIVIPKNHAEALALMRLSLLSAFFVAMLLTVAVLIAGERVTEVLGFAAVGMPLLLLPVAVLGASAAKIVSEWCVRFDRFGAIATASIAHSVAANAAKIGFGLMYPVGAVLIAIVTAMHVAKAALLSVVSLRRMPEISHPKEYTTINVAREYADFPTLHMPAGFLNRVAQNAPAVIIALILGPAPAGFYELARRIIKLPSQLLSRSVGRVYRRRAAKTVQRGGNTTGDLLRTVGVLLGAGVLPFGVIIIAGPTVFAVAFGEQWTAAGSVARWLALWYIVHVAKAPARQVLRVKRRLTFKLWWSAGSGAVKLAALSIVALWTGRLEAAVASYAVAATAADLLMVGAAAWRGESSGQTSDPVEDDTVDSDD